MSHRDDCLITTVEEATEWLERYRHTVGTFDPQVLRVIECLEQGQSEATDEIQKQLTTLQKEFDELTVDRDDMKDALEKISELSEAFQNTDFDDLDLDDPSVAEYQSAAFQLSCDINKVASAAL